MGTKGYKIQLPPLWKNAEASADQFRFIRSPKRVAVAGTGTKTGKTLGCSEWIIEGAGNHAGSLSWWIAPSRYQAKIGFDRCLSLLPSDKELVKPNLTDLTIRLGNGAVIEFKTGDRPDLLFGAAVHRCVVDEAARMREQAWHAVNTTMTQTQGPIRVASNTDKGKRNWFYPLYMRGQDPNDPDVESFSIKTYENPFISEEAIERFKRDLPPIAYMSLVEAVFPEDALSVFRSIERCFTDTVPIEYDENALVVLFDPEHRGRYVVGVDLAKYQDYTVITVIDISRMEVAYWQRLHRISWETQIEIIQSVASNYNNAMVLLDASKEGDAIKERLQLLKVPVEGYQFNNATKQRLIEKLALGIENREIKFSKYLTVLERELKSFEFNLTESGVVTYGAPDEQGIFDDSVISLALAFWIAANPFAVGYHGIDKRGNVLSIRGKWGKGRGF